MTEGFSSGTADQGILKLVEKLLILLLLTSNS
jgi:hypothetical protein